MPRQAPLNALKTFVIAAQHQSFQAAAHELHVTPGAVSRQIKALEQDLGKALFIRSTRRVELTHTGKSLWESIQPAMNMIHEAWQHTAGVTTSTTVHLECTPTFTMHWLIPRLRSYREQHPEVNVVVRTTQGVIDRATPSHLIIRRCPSQFSGLEGHPFMNEFSLLVCSAKYWAPSPAKKPRAPSSGSRTQIISIRSRPDLWPHWQAQQHDPSLFHNSQVITFDNTILALQAAVQGLGIALIPHIFLNQHLLSGELIQVPASTPLLTGVYHWLSPRKKLSNAEESFIIWLCREGRHENHRNLATPKSA